MSIIKEGSLFKKCKKSSGWLKRYYIIQSNLLLKYKKKPGSKSTIADETVDLSFTTIQSSTIKQFSFTIVNIHNSSTLYLCANDASEARDWIDALNKASGASLSTTKASTTAKEISTTSHHSRPAPPPPQPISNVYSMPSYHRPTSAPQPYQQAPVPMSHNFPAFYQYSSQPTMTNPTQQHQPIYQQPPQHYSSQSQPQPQMSYQTTPSASPFPPLPPLTNQAQTNSNIYGEVSQPQQENTSRYPNFSKYISAPQLNNYNYNYPPTGY
ncbi:hypothetical protein CYY_005195 [Polysphondylium violaceum]|uniref:PH domain-containing protein n=1 Tax=Polysphondylium violaceum TaxID=133409 RepID=A0A8J4USD4_9MYCE|nr:hypothetical protein CYY_005195 [Polysphondylium violaceum]